MKNLNRLQGKALMCLIGVLVLLILAVAGLRHQKIPKEEPHVPVVQEFYNAWIVEVTESGIRFFNGALQEYAWENPEQPLVNRDAREQIADVTVTDGKITRIYIKDREKISGKVLGVVSGQGVEVEGKGLIEYAPHMKMYRLYNTLALSGESEIRIGYNFCDYVLEDGKICAVLVTREEAMEYIRVQIKGSDYASSTHESVTLTSDTDFVVRYGEDGNMIEEIHSAGEVVEIKKDSDYFVGDRIFILPGALTGKISLLSVNRSQGTPGYRGTMEIVKKGQDSESSLYIVNELLLEEYLYAVVPSEMPSSYPGEALKAQAICARTYAYGHMLMPANRLVGAHVDDSAGYQVYNNILEQDTTTRAVKETNGQLLYAEESLVDTYYYSTSCGFGSDASVWKGSERENPAYLQAKRLGTSEGQQYTAKTLMEEETFADFISRDFDEDFESGEGWYRWTYTVEDLDQERILTTLQKRYEASQKLILTRNKDGEFVSESIKKLGKIKNIYIEKRGAGGVAEEMVIEASENTIKVITEHNIRYVLCDGKTQVYRQDGSKVSMPNLLPSAFFTIEVLQEKNQVTGYILTGGGFGHGVGMSQNGARAMAGLGYTGQEILQFFFPGSHIREKY